MWPREVQAGNETSNKQVNARDNPDPRRQEEWVYLSRSKLVQWLQQGRSDLEVVDVREGDFRPLKIAGGARIRVANRICLHQLDWYV